MDKLMVGDIVKINPNNVGKDYPLYLEWFRFYGVNEKKFEPNLPSLKKHIDAYDEDYVVRWIAPHLRYDKMLFAIEGIKTGRIFLVDRDVIAGYYHTENSTDCCYDINERLLVQEIIRLNSEIDMLKEEVISLEEKSKEKSKEKDNINVKTNPMPPLENGWFGLCQGYNFNGERTEKQWFVAILKEEGFTLIFEDGGHDDYRNKRDVLFYYNANGVCKDEEGKVLGEIVFLCDAYNFSHAKKIYKGEIKHGEIWRKY